MKVEITKLTDVKLLQRANSFTTGRDSHMTLAQAYRAGHSPIRTQLFWVECTDIPLFVASQLVRSHVGAQFFQRSKRTDRGGEDFNDVCRNLAFNVNTSWITKDAPENIDVPRLANDLSEVSKEIGDVLWYCATMAHNIGFTLQEIAQMNIDRLASRQQRGKLGGSGDNR